MQRIRTFFQVFFLIVIIITGIRFTFGWSRTSIETYCPFGGLETALSLITHQQFTCATGERNLALFIGLIVLTLLSKKSFCSWICPLGTISEWFFLIGKRLFKKRRRDSESHVLHSFEPPRKIDRVLRWVRLPILLIILYFTYKTGELIFRGYDPYYILFSFHGHDVYNWSYIILVTILAGIVVFPMAWCRYLCPLGISLLPFSCIGRIRIVRSELLCTNCQSCDIACPQAIDVSRKPQVISGDCTLCLKCIAACPIDNSLELFIK